MISFRASAADYTSVKKINTNYGYMITNQDAVLGEFSPFSEKDRCAVRKLPCIWGEKGKDAHFIADSFLYAGDCGYGEISSRYFGLTTQTEDLNIMKPIKILGLIQTTYLGKNKTRIDYMQVNPFYVYNNPYSVFMEVGTTMVKSVINKIFPKDEITLFSPEKVTGFFRKLGFEIVENSTNGDVLMRLKR